jgi:hypothetical protein
MYDRYYRASSSCESSVSDLIGPVHPDPDSGRPKLYPKTGKKEISSKKILFVNFL